jgi:hypothetical protein
MRNLDWKWIWGILITIIIGILPFIISIPSSRNKSLAVKENFNSQIVSISNDSLRKNLTFFYKDKRLDNLYTIEISLVNDGAETINKQDFEKPLIIKFDSPSKIFSYEVVRSNPTNINYHINSDSNSLSIEPMLINPGDELTIGILISNLSKIPTIDGRISGIKEVKFKKKEIREPMRYEPLYWLSGLFLTTITISLMTLYIVALLRRKEIQTNFSFNKFLLLGVALICWYSGLSLMQNGVYYYGIDPARWIRYLTFGPYYLIVVYLTVLNFRKRHEKQIKPPASVSIPR